MAPGRSARSASRITTTTVTGLLGKPERANQQKDDEELQLEKLVFGDDEGFRTALKTYDSDDFRHGDFTSSSSSSDDDDDEHEQEELGRPETGQDLDAVADDDVCIG